MFEDIVGEEEIITVSNIKEYYCNKCDFTILKSSNYDSFIQCDECGSWLQAKIKEYQKMNRFNTTYSC